MAYGRDSPQGSFDRDAGGLRMGFIKRSDGDADHIVDRVFDDVGEVLDEIIEHTDPDGELTVVTVPAEPKLAEETN